MNTVETLVTRMLRENTGKRLTDSGGESGRAWQRNQHVDFTRQPPAIVRYSSEPLDDETTSLRFYEKVTNLEVSISTYWFLTQLLTVTKQSALFDAELQALLTERTTIFSASETLHIPTHSFTAAMWDIANRYHNGTDYGFYPGQGVTYTYNDGGSNLSQDIQYLGFSYTDPRKTAQDENPYYVIVQTHNGADASTGMSTPRVFAWRHAYLDPANWLSGMQVLEAYETGGLEREWRCEQALWLPQHASLGPADDEPDLVDLLLVEPGSGRLVLRDTRCPIEFHPKLEV